MSKIKTWDIGHFSKEEHLGVQLNGLPASMIENTQIYRISKIILKYDTLCINFEIQSCVLGIKLHLHILESLRTNMILCINFEIKSFLSFHNMFPHDRFDRAINGTQ